jgi:hypothetical protein
MQFYSATKKNEILLFAGRWMELENIILSEVRQIQKAKSCMFSPCHMWNISQLPIQQYYETLVTLRRGHILEEEDKRKKLRR